MQRPREVRPFLPTLMLLIATVVCLGMPASASADVWQQWVDGIKSDLNYSVSQGAAHVMTDSSSPAYYPTIVPGMDDCALLQSVFGSCGGNNGSGAYVDIEPPVENEFIDPCYYPKSDTTCDINAVSTTNSFSQVVTLPDGSSKNVNIHYFVDDTEALITIINLPPQAAYFAMETYIFSRKRDDGCVGTGADPCRVTVAGSINNAINQVRIADQSGLSWNGTIAVITTANQTLYQQLANEFVSAGGNAKLIFLDPLGKAYAGNLPKRNTPPCDEPHPSGQVFMPPFYCAIVRTGLDTGATAASSVADEFYSSLRYTLPNDSGIADQNSPSEQWKQAITSNVRVYRVRAAALTAGALFKNGEAIQIVGKLYNTEEQDDPSGAYSFPEAVDELNSVYVQPFLSAVLPAGALPLTATMYRTETLVQSSDSAHDAGERPYQYVVGPACIAQLFSCAGDNQDTDAYMFSNDLELYNTGVLVGVDSANPTVNNASYIGLSLYLQDGAQSFVGSSLNQTNSSAGATGFFKGTLGAGNPQRNNRSSAEDFVTKLVAAGVAPAPSANLAAFLPRLLVGIYSRDCAAGNPLLLQFCAMTPAVDSYTIAIDPSHYPPPIPGVEPNYLSLIRRAYLRPRTAADPANQQKTNGADPKHMFRPIVTYY